MFNATDKVYQETPMYLPDKESTWSYPACKDCWVHAHNALRGEMTDIKDTLIAIEGRNQPLVEWELVALRKLIKSHFMHKHSHHSKEDHLFIPELQKRIKLPSKLVDDHLGLVKEFEKLESILSSLKVGDHLQPSELLQHWSIYQEMMLPHLQEEEDIGLPLMRAYFTQMDITPLIQKLMAHGPKCEMGSFIHYMGGPEPFRAEFMKQEGMPGYAWYVDFHAKYKYFMTEFIQNADALKNGIQPSKPWYHLPLFTSLIHHQQECH
jgi:hemerythrin-like domain-containing protein